MPGIIDSRTIAIFSVRLLRWRVPRGPALGTFTRCVSVQYVVTPPVACDAAAMFRHAAARFSQHMGPAGRAIAVFASPAEHTIRLVAATTVATSGNADFRLVQNRHLRPGIGGPMRTASQLANLVLAAALSCGPARAHPKIPSINPLSCVPATP